ncbi:energy-coupling factor transporter transmembrane component T [Collinsella aerofaciens]|nr:energy-coupling factor transporter transmembrane component T [Collinsella aerofaciens]MDB1904235.1 energy-coupling factor transporter transmembrane component T [Collinsella aerofaciens]
MQKALPACRYCIMAREILLSKKTEQGLRLDPRTKLLLIFIISIFVMGGTGGEAMGLIRLVLCTVPAILLLTSKQCAKAVGYIAVFSAFYAVQIYVLPHLTGILNFLVLFTTGFFCRILPSVAIAAYAVKTTTVSELISGMERIHMPKEVTIPLTVMFRFFPTVFQESEAISDAMKMRGIKLGGKKSSKILEYKLIPMITCSVKIGEELSAAAITRGLGAPVKRTNICQLKFNFADVVLILFCCFVVFWAIASPIISAGGILP